MEHLEHCPASQAYLERRTITKSVHALSLLHTSATQALVPAHHPHVELRLWAGSSLGPGQTHLVLGLCCAEPWLLIWCLLPFSGPGGYEAECTG
jgi:hypothetical protein